jgi:hypothetical protein
MAQQVHSVVFVLTFFNYAGANHPVRRTGFEDVSYTKSGVRDPVSHTGLEDAALSSGSDPVRRTSQRNSPSDLHCVVWGDGPYFGMKSSSESVANERFKKAKTEELIAVHYDKRMREVQRYQSHRVKAVFWHRLTNWCKENNENDAQAEGSVDVDASGSVEQFKAQSPPASLLSENVAPETVRASSSLAGTVGVLEKELSVIASTTSSMFKSIGQADPMLDMKVGGADGKLKTRVDALDRYVSAMLGATPTLEEELTGAVGSGPPNSPSFMAKISIKGKIDALLPKVDNLKKRVSALESSHVSTDLDKLEGKMASFRTKAASLMETMGLEEAQSNVAAAPAEPQPHQSHLNGRIADLERLITDVQRSTQSLGYEMLERSFTENTASAKAGPLKVKVESLVALVDDLDVRFKDLETNSLKNVMDKLEEKVASFHSKVIEVSKRVSDEAQLEYKDTSTLPNMRARVAALEKYTSEAQQKLDAVEVELLGAAKSLPESSGVTNTMKGRLIAFMVKIDGLLERVHSLEQEV